MKIGEDLFAEVDFDEKWMSAVVSAARKGILSDNDIGVIAVQLASSGAQLARDGNSADVASTGGIGSLSTLLCPLQLKLLGFNVHKIGVPGRPAGAIDVLQCVPGFNAWISESEARALATRPGAFHIIAGGDWVPLDAMLFQYRQRSNAQAIPSLVIASLLAKKIAAGTTIAGLDVRVSKSSNFGRDMHSARENSVRYNRVARLLGLRGVCVLSDCSKPYQPFIGRGEALLALWLTTRGMTDEWLLSHIEFCAKMTMAITGRDAAGITNPSNLRSALSAVLVAQGATWQSFERKVEQVSEAPRTLIRAQRDGYILYDMDLLKKLLVSRQRPFSGNLEMPIDAAGVIVMVRPGERVSCGRPILAVRCAGDDSELVSAMTECVHILDAPTWDKECSHPAEIEILDA